MENRAEFVVDWDGTCVEEVWPGMGDWLPGAVNALKTLSGLGKTVIYSLRCHAYEQDDETPRRPTDVKLEQDIIRAKLDSVGLHDVEVYPNGRGKPPGKYYIDDRALRFDGDWTEVLAKIAVDRAKELREADLVHNVGSGLLVEPEDAVRAIESMVPPIYKDQIAARVREFVTGATRDTDDGKLDYEGFFSPHVLERRAQYMHKNRIQNDGSLRASDNWQKGISLDSYMKSMMRHFIEVWIEHRHARTGQEMQEALCAVMFNAEGYLFELLRDERIAAAGD